MGASECARSCLRTLLPSLPILFGFALVSLVFNVAIPLLEAPDEPSHVAMVRYIESHHALPIQQPPSFFPVGQEGSQPPLYYVLGAALLHLSPGPSLAPTFDAHNPFVTFDRSSPGLDNRNLYAHTPREAFPYRGDALGIHLVRLLGTLLGVATVLLTFLIAQELFSDRLFVAPLAAALVAFDPQFAFVSGVVNNDNAITTAATLVLWCLVRWCRRGGTTPASIVLGVGLGAALLSKTDGILLIPFVAFVLIVESVGKRNSGHLLRRAGLVVVLALTISGWWFVRNWRLYGDLLGWDAMLAANASMIRHPPIDLWSALRILWLARETFWGAFGWTNVFLPPGVYQALDLLAAVAVVGLLGLLRRLPAWLTETFHSSTEAIGKARGRLNTVPELDRTRLPGWSDVRRVAPFLILGGWPVAVFVSLARWVQINEAADQWRLLFPAIAPIAILFALGLDEVPRTIATALGMARTRAGETEIHSVDRVYAPSTNGRAVMPTREENVGTRRAQRLVDIPALQTTWHPVPVSTVVEFHSPTIALSTAAGPGYRVWARSGVSLAIAVVGAALNALVIRGVVAPAYQPTATTGLTTSAESPIRFGDAIELIGYRVHPDRLSPGGTLEVDLDWRAIRPIERNWAVSLGVVGDGDSTLAKVQTWPQGGRAPTTGWLPGRLYHDRYVLSPRWTSAEPQLASVWLDLYDASVLGGPSLSVSDSGGRQIGNGIIVGQVKLTPTETVQARPSEVVGATFGSSVELLGYDATVEASRLTITLYWRDVAPLTVPYTVFVHVAEADGKVVAQHDGPPHDGSYPTTVWETGEIIRDRHVVDLKGVAPATYRVLVGLYQRSTGQRLPIRTDAGASVPNDALPLFDLDVPAGGR